MEVFGGVIYKNENGKTALSQALSIAEIGKEYLLSAGSHCAIIRKTEKGYEYLELQSSTENGYKSLNSKILRERFKFHYSSSVYGFKLPISVGILPLETMNKRKDELYYLSGYLNTDGENQKKGDGGYEK